MLDVAGMFLAILAIKGHTPDWVLSFQLGPEKGHTPDWVSFQLGPVKGKRHTPDWMLY